MSLRRDRAASRHRHRWKIYEEETRDKGTTDDGFLSAEAEIAVVQLRKVRPGVFIGVRLALKNWERDEDERGAVSFNHPTKQKPSGIKKILIFILVVLDRPFVAQLGPPRADIARRR